MKQLEEAGVVARWADPRDNRFTLVALTDEGRRLVAGLMEQRAVFEAHTMAGISEAEILITQRCLSRIRANLAVPVSEVDALDSHPDFIKWRRLRSDLEITTKAPRHQAI